MYIKNTKNIYGSVHPQETTGRTFHYKIGPPLAF